MAKDVEIIQVCFSKMDPDQVRMHEWVCSRPNRSGYLKRLIQRDMEGGAAVSGVMNTQPAAPSMNDFSLNGFI